MKGPFLAICLLIAAHSARSENYYQGISCADFEGTNYTGLQHPRDCTKYYTCINGDLRVNECSFKLYFDPDKNDCDWPDLVYCAADQPACETPTTVATPTCSTPTVTTLPPCQVTTPVETPTCPVCPVCPSTNTPSTTTPSTTTPSTTTPSTTTQSTTTPSTTTPLTTIPSPTTPSTTTPSTTTPSTTTPSTTTPSTTTPSTTTPSTTTPSTTTPSTTTPSTTTPSTTTPSTTTPSTTTTEPGCTSTPSELSTLPPCQTEKPADPCNGKYDGYEFVGGYSLCPNIEIGQEKVNLEIPGVCGSWIHCDNYQRAFCKFCAPGDLVFDARVNKYACSWRYLSTRFDC